MDNHARAGVLIVLFFIGGIIIFLTAHFHTRLEKLEAASTVAQQPQERHYPDFITDTITLRDTGIVVVKYPFVMYRIK